jgi:hypothetical protein
VLLAAERRAGEREAVFDLGYFQYYLAVNLYP